MRFMDYKDAGVSQRIAGEARKRVREVRSKPRTQSTATEDVGYARASKDREVDHKGRPRAKEKSVTRQRADGDALAQQHDLGSLEWFVDNDIKGGDFAPRPRYNDLLELIESRVVRTVVTDSLDRIGREGVEQAEFLLICEVHGVRVLTGEGDDIDFSRDDPDNAVTMAEIRNSIAKAERNKIRRRMRVTLAHKAKDGQPHSGKRAFGFESDNRTHRDDEAQLIKAAVRAIKSGKATQSSIAADWQAASVPTATSESRAKRGLPPTRWHPEVVKNLLLSPRMIGVRSHHGEMIKGTWKPIISEADQIAVRLKLAGEPQGPKPRIAILTGGLLICGALVDGELCGTALTTWTPVGGVRKYRCATSRGGCGRISIKAEEVELIIVRAFFHRLDRIYAASKRRVVRDLNDERGKAMAAVERHKLKLSDLAELFGSDKMSKSDYEDQAGKAQERLRRARRRLADIPEGDAIAALVSSRAELAADWDKRSIVEQHDALRLLLDHVPIMPATPPFSVFNPERIGDPVWRA